MILHKLIYRYLRYGDDESFYRMQAEDAVRLLERSGIALKGTSVLDLGCGHGFIGGELLEKGARVTFADEKNSLPVEIGNVDYRDFVIGEDDLTSLGEYDLVICSNILEHIPDPGKLIGTLDKVLTPGGRVFLSWTNWLSPWGGHDFSPFHYLGPRSGKSVFEKVMRRRPVHTPFVTLFPTSIHGILKMIRANQRLQIEAVIPRYYPGFAFVTRIPVVREFLTFNCLVFVKRAC